MCSLIKLLSIVKVGKTEEQHRGIQGQRAVAVTSQRSTLNKSVNKRNPNQEHQWVSGGRNAGGTKTRVRPLQNHRIT